MKLKNSFKEEIRPINPDISGEEKKMQSFQWFYEVNIISIPKLDPKKIIGKSHSKKWMQKLEIDAN